MALYKEIKQADGVTTAYHRILYITSTTNSHISIAVGSYVDQEARGSEILGTLAQPYLRAITYELSYVENMTIEAAYDYLKTLPAFAGATDA